MKKQEQYQPKPVFTNSANGNYNISREINTGMFSS